MKKLLVASAFALLASAAFAFSWSGIIDNNTKVSTSEFKAYTLEQSNGIYLSANSKINNNMRLAAEGLYKYNLTLTESSKTFSNIADVDLLKLSGLWKVGTSNVALDFGRFSISDISNTVFSQCSDGLNFKYETAKMKVGLYGGYTGFLNSLNVSMVDTLPDTKDFYSLTAAYIPVGVNFAATTVLGSNVLGAQSFYFKAISTGLTDKIYGTVSLTGPIKTVGSYSAVVVAGLNDYKNFMLYAKADAAAFIANKGMVSGGVEYASGNNGGLKNFVTITSKPVTCTGIQTSGVIVPKVSAMYVSGGLFASLTEKIVVTMPENSADFAGVDSTLSVLYNVFSDLQIGFDVLAFTAKESANSKYSFTAKATLAF